MGMRCWGLELEYWVWGLFRKTMPTTEIKLLPNGKAGIVKFRRGTKTGSSGHHFQVPTIILSGNSTFAATALCLLFMSLSR